MTTRNLDLSRRGRLNPPMSMCSRCGHDLVVRTVNNGREAYFYCSRAVCKHATSPHPTPNKPCGGPGK